MNFTRGDINAQSDPGDNDPSTPLSIVIASSSMANKISTLMGTIAGTITSKSGRLIDQTFSLLRVSNCTQVFKRVRSNICGSLALLPLPFVSHYALLMG